MCDFGALGWNAVLSRLYSNLMHSVPSIGSRSDKTLTRINHLLNMNEWKILVLVPSSSLNPSELINIYLRWTWHNFQQAWVETTFHVWKTHRKLLEECLERPDSKRANTKALNLKKLCQDSYVQVSSNPTDLHFRIHLNPFNEKEIKRKNFNWLLLA